MTARVLIVAEHDEAQLADATRHAVGAARALEPACVDVAVLARDGADVARSAAAIAGVDRVRWISGPEHAPCLAAVWAPRIARLAVDYTHVLAGVSTFSKDLLPRVAALLGVGMLSDVTAIDAPYRFARPIYAGNAVVRITADPALTLCATIRPAAFEAPAATGHARIDAEAVTGDTPAHTRFVERRGGRHAGPDLQTAQRVVAGGRGLAGEDGFALLERLAAALGAAVGASRAAVDSGWVANDLQIGQTGKIIAPALYVAVGISGAIQHLTGIKDAGTIVAINNDAEAPICAIADITLIADLFEALPELIESLESRRRL